MVGARVLSLVAASCVAVTLSLALPASDSSAQAPDPGRAKAAPKAGGAPRSVRAPAPRASSRVVAPRTGRAAAPRTVVRRAIPRTGRAVTTRRTIVTPRTKRVVTRRAPKITTLPRTTKRVARKAPSVVPRTTRQTIRRAPTNLALVNRGLRQSPKRYKPASVTHDPKRKAGRSGWMHRHRPFFFKHNGHRWRRHYYSFLVSGLWYWYWYDVIADDDPAALVYSEVVLPDCNLESDECIEPGAIVAPAILEGRATEEDMARCAEAFVSFDPSTGTYLTYAGEVRVCPYLE